MYASPCSILFDLSPPNHVAVICQGILGTPQAYPPQ